MRLIDADKFKCILPCNEGFHRIINSARTVKAIPCKDIEKMRAEIEQAKDTDFQRNRKTYDKCLEIIDKYIGG